MAFVTHLYTIPLVGFLGLAFFFFFFFVFGCINIVFQTVFQKDEEPPLKRITEAGAIILPFVLLLLVPVFIVFRGGWIAVTQNKIYEGVVFSSTGFYEYSWDDLKMIFIDEASIGSTYRSRMFAEGALYEPVTRLYFPDRDTVLDYNPDIIGTHLFFTSQMKKVIEMAIEKNVPLCIEPEYKNKLLGEIPNYSPDLSKRAAEIFKLFEENENCSNANNFL